MMVMDWWHAAQPAWNYCLVIGISCAGLAIVTSSRHLLQHWCSNSMGVLRFVRTLILLMVPLYAFTGMIRLTISRSLVSELLSVTCNFYQAVVILAFMQLLFLALNGPDQMAVQFASSMQKPQLSILKCFPTRVIPGVDYMCILLRGIFQFSLVALLTTAVVFCSRSTPLTIVAACFKVASGVCADRCLKLLCLQVDQTAAIKFVQEKFLCVRWMILLAGFQELACILCKELHLLDGLLQGSSAHDGSGAERAEAFSGLLLCCEMLAFAIAHTHAFPANEDESKRKLSLSWTESGIALRFQPNTEQHELKLATMISEIWSLSRQASQQRAMVKRLYSSSAFTDEDLQTCFRLFDVDKNGVLTRAEFAYICECACLPQRRKLSDSDDDQDDDKVTFEEFRQALQAKTEHGAEVSALV
jgi:hypothetical protein